MPAKKSPTKKFSKRATRVRRTSAPVTKADTPRLKKKPVLTNAKPSALATKPPRKLYLGMHAIIAGSAICVMLLLGVIERNTFATRQSSAESAVPATIGLEHDAPLSMSMLFAKKENAGYVSIFNQSSETIHISLPSTWTRTEVTGASLRDVPQEIPVFGFSRYTVPGKVGMKLLMPSAPDAIFFDSPSQSTAAIDLKTINLTTLDVANRVVLVQHQTLVPLWGGND